MRRRFLGRRRLTAEQLVALDRRLHGEFGDDWQARRVALLGVGYDPVTVIRARLWLRRGKPRGYQWHD